MCAKFKYFPKSPKRCSTFSTCEGHRTWRTMRATTTRREGQKGEGLDFPSFPSSRILILDSARARGGALEQWRGAMHSRCRSLLPSPSSLLSGKNPTSRATSGTRFSRCAISPGRVLNPRAAGRPINKKNSETNAESLFPVW